ncbi:MAG: C40 family peptidase [Flavobacteriaceae bacterium]|nr:C40 family peptidase [Flavobacteriaceae bacterium]
MIYGICNLGIIPVRKEPFHTSEMTNQLLFGEHFIVLERDKNWSKIKLNFDGSEGYISSVQYQEIPEDFYYSINSEKTVLSGEILDFISNVDNNLITIPLGATLPSFNGKELKLDKITYTFDGKVNNGKLSKKEIIHNAFAYLNSPYLWGGKTPFGIDCSGFTQMVYKLCGYQLNRDAKDQASQGEVLSFIEESEPGDLAFFDNEEGEIVHVGIILKDYNIIHAHGKVRIDTLDHSGIYNSDLQTHTHKLRIIKRII